MELHRYRVGGQLVMMAHAAAARWNAGQPSKKDLARSSVWIGNAEGEGDWVHLHRAMNPRLHAKLAAMLEGQEAVLDRCRQFKERIVG